jgi:lysocardiolipin and lysophospholipid acyltransferase
MHWRRYAISAIPIKDDTAFDAWLMERWREKDAFLEYFEQHGSFSIDESNAKEALTNGSLGTEAKKTAQGTGPVTAKVSTAHPLDFLQIFISLLAVPVAWKLGKWVWWSVKIILLVATLGTVRL